MSDEEMVMDPEMGQEDETNNIEGESNEVDGSAETEAPEAEPTIEEQLAAALAESAEHQDARLRAVAEMANARKRFEKERRLARINASIDVVTDLLPVLDDIDLAMANVPEDVSSTEWYGGFSLIPRKMGSILERLGIEKIESVGSEFDPELHNAIMREESEAHESDTVIKEFQPGYKFGDRVIRPAVVVVAA